MLPHIIDPIKNPNILNSSIRVYPSCSRLGWVWEWRSRLIVELVISDIDWVSETVVEIPKRIDLKKVTIGKGDPLPSKIIR